VGQRFRTDPTLGARRVDVAVVHVATMPLASRMPVMRSSWACLSALASRGGLFELLDSRGHHLRQAPCPGSAPEEPPDELSVHEHGVALGDPVDGARPDRGVPALDRIGRHGAREHDDVTVVLRRIQAPSFEGADDRGPSPGP
jgi:hypothetical protein